MAIENPGSCEHCARFTMKSLRRRLARQASLSGHNPLMSPSPVPAAGIHPCRAAHHGSFIMGWTAWRLRPSAQCVQHGWERKHFEEEGQSDFLLSEEEEDLEDSPFLPPAHTAQPLAAAGSMEDADGAPSPLLSVDLQDVCKRGSRDWTHYVTHGGEWEWHQRQSWYCASGDTRPFWFKGYPWAWFESDK